MNFDISNIWDGTQKEAKCRGKNVHLALKAESHGSETGIRIEITAPFYGDPAPQGPPGPFFQLWDYEVVEAFFLAPASKDGSRKETYLELEFGPHAQHLALLLNGRKNIIEKCLPIQYEAKIDYSKYTWKGTAWIPMDYFPPGVNKFNAYSIHGTEENRIYEALYPVPGPFPDFHRIEHFQLINFNQLRPENDSADFSEVWKSALKKNQEKP